jgi:hypothetical protein
VILSGAYQLSLLYGRPSGSRPSSGMCSKIIHYKSMSHGGSSLGTGHGSGRRIEQFDFSRKSHSCDTASTVAKATTREGTRRRYWS